MEPHDNVAQVTEQALGEIVRNLGETKRRRVSPPRKRPGLVSRGIRRVLGAIGGAAIGSAVIGYLDREQEPEAEAPQPRVEPCVCGGWVVTILDEDGVVLKTAHLTPWGGGDDDEDPDGGEEEIPEEGSPSGENPSGGLYEVA